jgi:hypothetical protein
MMTEAQRLDRRIAYRRNRVARNQSDLAFWRHRGFEAFAKRCEEIIAEEGAS